MRTSFILALAATLAVVQGCSRSHIKWTWTPIDPKELTYEMLQDYDQKKCRDDPHADCPKGESYEKYQQKREEAKRDE